MTTTYFANCIMGNLFKTNTNPGLPSVFYIGLSTTEPTTGGANVTEPADTAYSRVKLTSLSAPVDGVIYNTEQIGFADSTVDWGTITHFVIYDAQTGGNLLVYNTLDKQRTVYADSQITFRAKGLRLALKDVTT